MTDEYLTVDEMKRLSSAEFDTYVGATREEKVGIAAQHRQRFAQRDTATTPKSLPLTSALRTYGLLSFVLGLVGVVILAILGMPSVMLLWLCVAIASLGFWGFLFGVIEERLLDINATLKSRQSRE